MTPRGFSGHPELSTRLLESTDFEALADLRAEVLAALPDPDCYVAETDEAAFFAEHREPHGQTIGVFDAAGRLVAYAMLGLPLADTPGNLAAVTGMDDASRAACAHLSSCMVRPGWRGRGLQRTLLGARLALAHAQGRHLCLAVVSLRNHSSRHNMLRRGLHLAWVGEIDGLRRQVAMIDLRHGLHSDPGDERLIDSDDFDTQRQAITDGYRGVGEVRGADDRVEWLRFWKHLEL